MPTTPSFIYFDLGNVLFFFDHTLVCQQLAEVTGVPRGDIGAFLDSGDYTVKLETGAVTIEQIHEEFCRTFSVSPGLEQVALAASDIFELNAAMLPLLGSLAAANQRLGILSNTSVAHWEFLIQRYAILSRLFDLSALSYKLHVMKPNRKVYDAAARLAGVPGESIFFTDDRQENVAAAIAAGWQAVQFEDPQQLAEELRSRGVKFN